MAGNLETKITITAVDKASPVIAKLAQAFEKLKSSGKGIGAAFNNVTSAASDFGKRLATLGIVAAAAGGALFALAKSQAAYTEKLEIMHQKTGFSTESLQKWQFIAKLNRLELEDMVLGMRGLSKVMATAAVNPKDDMAKWFKKNNIAIKDAKGQLLPLEGVFQNISEVFKNAPNGAAKMATAMKLFGRAGLNLIPILNLGKEKFAELMAEVQKYGFFLTDKMKKEQLAFDDSIDRTMWSIDQLKMAIGSKLIPMFAPMVEGLRNWINENRDLIANKVGAFATELGAGLTIVGKALYGIGIVLAPIVDMFGGLRTVIAAIAFVYLGGLIASFVRLAASLVMLVPALMSGALAMWAFLAPVLIAAAPFILIAAAIGLVGFALYQLISRFQEFKQAAQQLWAALPEGLRAAIETIGSLLTMGLLNKVNAAIDAVKAIYNSVTKFFGGGAEKKPAAATPTPATLDTSSALGKTDQVLSGITSSIKIAEGATGGLGDAFKSAGMATITAISPVLGVLQQVVAAVNSIKAALSSLSANPINIAVQTSGVPAAGAKAGSPAAGAAAPAVGKTALLAQPQVGQLALAQPQKAKLDVYMKIDSEGRPKNVKAKSSSKMDFAANAGVMV